MYKDEFRQLRQLFDINKDAIALPEKQGMIYNLPFESAHYKILPGENEYDDNGLKFPKTPDYRHAISPEINEILNLADSKVHENRFFKYTVFKPDGDHQSKGVIILFHGLNEKNWDKYFAWAKSLMQKTGKTVALFPIAFHINRAPADWADVRTMQDLKYVRQELFPAVVGSSFANVAISTRLHILPQRFFWSGLQTFYDVVQFVKNIRTGKHPLFAGDATVDFFAYSIGAFLAQVLLMQNPEGLLTNSRLFIFCGGPVFNRMAPVQKTIIDSEASIALYSFFLEHLDTYLKTDSRLRHYFSQAHPEGMVFKSMVDYNKMIAFREKKLTAISNRVKAVVLREDKVVPWYEAVNTLKGIERNIPIQVEILDFDYPYTHENPFPVQDKLSEAVHNSFEEVFTDAAAFLGF
jgi:pimeloyl-ACP methyl ester carboxylesterase